MNSGKKLYQTYLMKDSLLNKKLTRKIRGFFYIPQYVASGIQFINTWKYLIYYKLSIRDRSKSNFIYFKI